MVISEFIGEYEFLSNFYPAPILFSGINYPTSEHAFQALKTLSIEDRLRIANLATPGQAKRAGQKVQLRADWEQIKFSIMEEILKAKFSQHPGLKERLLSTKGYILEEGNTWNDRVWGISPPRSNNGQNNLGKILMQIREELC